MKLITTGTENFKEFIDKIYYYVDKTMLIDDVLSDKVMLYTSPRHFGKTLNMSMLYYFFSNQEKVVLCQDFGLHKYEKCN